MNIFQQIKTNAHLRENGKSPILTDTSPVQIIHQVRNTIAYTCLPPHMQNKDNFRNISRLTIADTFEEIMLTQNSNKFISFNTYYKAETPQNKLLMLMTTFDTLYKFFKENVPQPVKVTYDEEDGILTKTYVEHEYHDTAYNNIPKRYRSAILPSSTQPGYLTPVNQNPNKKISLLFKNINAEMTFDKKMQEARELIDSIYHETTIQGDLIEYDSGCDSNGWWEYTKYETLYVAQPSTKSKKQQKLVSDEELNTINKLNKLFKEIADMVYFVQRKTNAVDIMAEFETAEQTKGILFTAQQHINALKKTIETAGQAANLLSKKNIAEQLNNYEESREILLHNVSEAVHHRFM